MDNTVSKEEFIKNLWSARSLLVHQVLAPPGVDVKGIERRLAHADLWLTPSAHAVQGFNPSDFPELSAQSRAKLERSVQRFREVAARVPNNGPATPEQEKAARQAFETILKIMQPYFLTTEDVDKLDAAMKDIHFPKGVLTWEFEFGQDSSDYPAVWIWLVVEDRAAKDKAFVTATTEFSSCRT